ncbi:MAG: MTH938/NDUFAF3 family protein [Xanthobacteraceae bacterium]
MAYDRASPHLPRPAAIDHYGNGGFRFAGLSHRGSILCLPDGVWAIAVETPDAIGDDELSFVIATAPAVEHLLIGTGHDPWLLPTAMRARLRDHGIVAETMSTGAAVRTYNQLLAEGRRVGALLIAVE